MSSLNLVTQRLQHVVLFPELRSALRHMVAYDEDRKDHYPHWGSVIPTVQSLLNGSTQAIVPFTAAWSLMFAVVKRLDHLQDGDPVEAPLPTVDRQNAQYNLLFSYYLLSAGLLDLLSPELIPVHRILRLRHVWTDMMLCMASGQQRDLTTSLISRSPLESYQQLAQAKAGAMFALAFGGAALLLTDDTQMIDALTTVGEIYGTLLQCGDDLLDVAQSNPTLTLPKALTMVRPTHMSDQTEHTPEAFFSYLYCAYHEQVVRVLVTLPDTVRHGILDLFDRTFSPQ